MNFERKKSLKALLEEGVLGIGIAPSTDFERFNPYKALRRASEEGMLVKATPLIYRYK